MMAEALKKHKRAFLLLLLFSPSIVFALDYLPNSLPSNSTRHYSAVASDQGYSVTMGVDYPSYVAAGQQVPVSLTLKMNFSSPYTAVSVDGARAELWYPSKINGTTNVVEQWQTLSSMTTQPAKNYTAPGSFSSVINMVATSPPSSSPLDLFIPATKFSINGASDLTLYATDANSGSSTNHVSVSLLDGQTTYQTQLPLMRSTTALFVYQLLAALLVSSFYLRTRSAVTGSIEKKYSIQLDSFRIQRSLAKLDDLKGLGRMAESGYAALKQKYDKELAQLKATS
jgi:hypothetical protein